MISLDWNKIYGVNEVETKNGLPNHESFLGCMKDVKVNLELQDRAINQSSTNQDQYHLPWKRR